MEEKEKTQEEREIIVEENVVKIEQEVEETEAESAEETESAKAEETEVEKPAYSESFNAKIEGKTEVELKDMLFQSEKFSGKQGTELGELRTFKRDTETPKTSVDIKQRIEKTKNKIESLDAQIGKLDAELDEDEISDLVEKKNYLLQKNAGYDSQKMELYVKELVEKQGAGQHNEGVSNNARQSFTEKYGQKFSDDEWSVVKDWAESVSKDYRVEPEDYEYALMKAVGIDKYKVLNSSMAETKVRNNIEKADKKAVPTIGGKGKSYLTLDMEGMSDYQISQQLDKLSDKELAKLKERINKG